MYDERDYDTSLPDTTTEELLACVHILYRIAHSKSVPEPYKFIDKWLLNPCDELEGIVPWNMLFDGEGIILVEYLRDVELRSSTDSTKDSNDLESLN
jgi:hypothetical protein